LYKAAKHLHINIVLALIRFVMGCFFVGLMFASARFTGESKMQSSKQLAFALSSLLLSLLLSFQNCSQVDFTTADAASVAASESVGDMGTDNEGSMTSEPHEKSNPLDGYSCTTCHNNTNREGFYEHRDAVQNKTTTLVCLKCHR
jgi:hypothetical protein